MSEDALMYRAKWGLLEKDEPMGLLVQRVSGAPHGRYFYPQAAGVALSFNPYVWNEEIDPKAGMTRLVFGLGTRAVDRNDDDYARIVALNAPARTPQSGEDARSYTQQKVTATTLRQESSRQNNTLKSQRRQWTMKFVRFVRFTRQRNGKTRSATRRKEIFSWSLTFEKLLTKTNSQKKCAKCQDYSGFLRRACGRGIHGKLS
jgi:hypothetical protein